ncbi:melanoma-associated antigen B16 [Peromyscus maniculatus bairdii]|uniref:melanoma-associated antigen B16 n=1 Tax=Peromyscus maniculatus bairdii TaxID=230844 RepID=UPI00077DACF6|nr:melanoma-associated antigen B16 [Peromyscus maniculatus bairdii]XP_042124970.1 melanoma-associated antigen B16 [Peromyscus maniculatus bairdii]XP_042124971.1 melanoma-associated antigen B16 [Peromyscus maniculatus bairdii]
MSQRQKNPECAADQGQTCDETQGLQVAAVSSDMEEPCTSSHLMASSLKSQTCEETQGLQVAAVSNDMEEPCSSSHLMASSLKSQPCKQTQGLNITQVTRDAEEPCTSSHSLMASYQNYPADETPSTSRGLQSPCASSGAGLSNQQVQGYPLYPTFQQDTMNVPMMSVDNKVDFLVNYMLYKYQMREIMSMTDILRRIVREDEYRYHEILMRAAERMEMVFGLDLKEVDPVNHCYALFIKLGLTYDGMRSDQYSFPKTGFLILILGVVFMKGNRATEDEIWEVLNPMGIYSGMNNFVFGDPRKLITEEFVKEQYLVYQPVANSNPVQYEYVWGPRARFETSKMKVLEFVAKVHGTDPTAFQSQYEEALIEEEERTLTMILNSAGPRSSSGASSSAMGSSFPHI